MKGPYCTEVHLDRGVIKAICQRRGKIHKGWLVFWLKSTFRTKMAIKSTKISAAMLYGLVHPTCRWREAMVEKWHLSIK